MIEMPLSEILNLYLPPFITNTS